MALHKESDDHRHRLLDDDAPTQKVALAAMAGKACPMNRLLARAFAVFALLLSASVVQAKDRGPLVLAAASLQEALTAAANAWTAKGYARPILSFASSSALARQIKAGAPADLFLSADEEWMDDIGRAGRIVRGTRADFVTNRLVLIAPASSTLRLPLVRNMPIGKALGRGRIAIANPDAVPAGKYGKAAMTSLGVWKQIADRLARADNVRGALALVERGAAPLGIVYATDARASRKVRVVGIFPADSHPPIRYPIARLTSGRHSDAEDFRRFLLSRAGQAILVRFGFSPAR